MTQEKRFEAIVAQWGVPNLNGQVLGYQAAQQLHDLLRKQETVSWVNNGFQIAGVRMEGDEARGKIWATFYSASTI